MARPSVSVVTPSLNHGSFIAQTVNSVLSQTDARFEYIVVDGASTDGTLETLEGLGSRVRWISEQDNGQSQAVNKGWKLSSGEIVAYLNADDTYLPGAIAAVVEFLQANPHIDIVYGDCDYVDEGGCFLRPYPTRPYDYLRLVKTTINYIPQPSVFLRRRVLERIGYLDESLSYVMDFEYWLRAGLSCSVAYLPKRLSTLRLHASAKSIRQLSRFAQELVAIYHGLFSRADLPKVVRATRRAAMSNIYYRAASCCFWSGQYRGARQYAFRAWRCNPANIRLPLFLSALGKPGREIMERFRGNPYVLKWPA